MTIATSQLGKEIFGHPVRKELTALMNCAHLCKASSTEAAWEEA
jgi:hypothetical protein